MTVAGNILIPERIEALGNEVRAPAARVSADLSRLRHEVDAQDIETAAE